jgi:hypothetical protein
MLSLIRLNGLAILARKKCIVLLKERETARLTLLPQLPKINELIILLRFEPLADTKVICLQP